MEPNENTGSIPKDPQTTPVLDDEGDAGKQPTTIAGGGLGPLETAIEKSEEADA